MCKVRPIEILCWSCEQANSAQLPPLKKKLMMTPPVSCPGHINDGTRMSKMKFRLFYSCSICSMNCIKQVCLLCGRIHLFLLCLCCVVFLNQEASILHLKNWIVSNLHLPGGADSPKLKAYRLLTQFCCAAAAHMVEEGLTLIRVHCPFGGRSKTCRLSVGG
jgi:hypothetical protein